MNHMVRTCIRCRCVKRNVLFHDSIVSFVAASSIRGMRVISSIYILLILVYCGLLSKVRVLVSLKKETFHKKQ